MVSFYADGPLTTEAENQLELENTCDGTSSSSSPCVKYNIHQHFYDTKFKPSFTVYSRTMMSKAEFKPLMINPRLIISWYQAHIPIHWDLLTTFMDW